MFRLFKNQRGIALILVISCILFLTIIVFDAWKDAQMGHQLAMNYRSRVQAYYMARSAINFAKLVLYFDKKLQSIMSQKKISAADVGFQPLYKQIPINSEAIRGLLAMSTSEAPDAETTEEPAATEPPPEGEEGASPTDELSQGVGLLKQEKLQDFLNFEGNFDAEISEEQSKYSLNAVSKMTSTSEAYDLHKRILLSMLMQPGFKNFFENQEADAENLTHAIADFVDSNTSVNEFKKVERGNEDSVYGNVDYKVKNAPFLTVSELRLVAGMSDDILEALKPMVTVYHTIDKINICLAESSVVDALIIHFTNYSECTSPLNPEDDKDEINRIRDEILKMCPDSNGVATTFNTILNINEADTKVSETDKGCKLKFRDLITDGNTIFRIKAVGEVKGVSSTITEVIDTSGAKVEAWKVLYYQVE